MKKTPQWYQNVQHAPTGQTANEGNSILKLKKEFQQTSNPSRPYKCNQLFKKLALSPQMTSYHLPLPEDGPARHVRIWTDGGLDPHTRTMTAGVYIPRSI
jgi:hypothetical protein